MSDIMKAVRMTWAKPKRPPLVSWWIGVARVDWWTRVVEEWPRMSASNTKVPSANRVIAWGASTRREEQ